MLDALIILALIGAVTVARWAFGLVRYFRVHDPSGNSGRHRHWKDEA